LPYLTIDRGIFDLVDDHWVIRERSRGMVEQNSGRTGAMRLPRRHFLQLAAGAAALPAVSHVARAETYPARPIRLVVPFPPGGAYDGVARPWVDKMKPLLGTIIVENIGGGGSSLGARRGRARPPGRLHHSPRRQPPAHQRGAAQEPAAL
jgi:hypothetical protein